MLLVYIYIYILEDICLSVCMFLPSFWPNLWVNFSENCHDHRYFLIYNMGKNIWKMVNMMMKKMPNYGATNLKFGMHTQLDSRSKMCLVPLDHISFSHCVRLKMAKMVFWK